jgi:ubiquinone/menaquinone biosynthesis C-methylase UbiE
MDEKNKDSAFEEIRTFYDSVYYDSPDEHISTNRHLRSLARDISIRIEQRVLDVACGTGQWLAACKERGAHVSGVDISQKAIDICKKNFPDDEFYCTTAESLPFEDDRFDIITCLGSLEHFVDQTEALNEMVRVARPDAIFVILVPNADFLTRKLGMYGGTQQTAAKEDVKTLNEWQELFEAAGLTITKKWKDLHVISWAWISASGWLRVPLRALQATALIIWPLKWQYQVYHMGKKTR